MVIKNIDNKTSSVRAVNRHVGVFHNDDDNDDTCMTPEGRLLCGPKKAAANELTRPVPGCQPIFQPKPAIEHASAEQYLEWTPAKETLFNIVGKAESFAVRTTSLLPGGFNFSVFCCRCSAKENNLMSHFRQEKKLGSFVWRELIGASLLALQGTRQRKIPCLEKPCFLQRSRKWSQNVSYQHQGVVRTEPKPNLKQLRSLYHRAGKLMITYQVFEVCPTGLWS